MSLMIGETNCSASFLLKFFYLDTVTIFHYKAVAVAELDYFETCGFLLLRHNANYVLQPYFRLLRHLVRSTVFDSFFLFVT